MQKHIRKNVNRQDYEKYKYNYICAVLSYVLYFCSLAGITTGVFSQTNVDFNKKNFPDKKKELRAALKELGQGDDLYEQAILPNSGNFSLALDHYLKAQDFNPNNALLNYKIGKCYLNSYNKIKAIPYLETALKLDPKVNPGYSLFIRTGISFKP